MNTLDAWGRAVGFWLVCALPACTSVDPQKNVASAAEVQLRLTDVPKAQPFSGNIASENHVPLTSSSLDDRLRTLEGNIHVPLDPALVAEREQRLYMLLLLREIRDELRKANAGIKPSKNP